MAGKQATSVTGTVPLKGMLLQQGSDITQKGNDYIA